jgi:hypothetical protein
MSSVIGLCCRSSEVEWPQLKSSDNVCRIKEQTKDNYERWTCLTGRREQNYIYDPLYNSERIDISIY